LDGAKYANDVQDIINYGTCGRVAGFVAEAIQVNTDICHLLIEFNFDIWLV